MMGLCIAKTINEFLPMKARNFENLVCLVYLIHNKESPPIERLEDTIVSKMDLYLFPPNETLPLNTVAIINPIIIRKSDKTIL